MIKSFDVVVSVEVIILDDKLDSMLKDYQNTISGKSGTINDMFAHIAWNEARWEGQFCEGCGDNGKDFVAVISGSEVEEVEL
jgi:hypothetical protein